MNPLDLEALKAKATALGRQVWITDGDTMIENDRGVGVAEVDAYLTSDEKRAVSRHIAAANPAAILKLIERIETMRLSLTALVNLKDHKDRCGKDEFYERHQPGVWSMAREALKVGAGEGEK